MSRSVFLSEATRMQVVRKSPKHIYNFQRLIQIHLAINSRNYNTALDLVSSHSIPEASKF